MLSSCAARQTIIPIRPASTSPASPVSALSANPARSLATCQASSWLWRRRTSWATPVAGAPEASASMAISIGSGVVGADSAFVAISDPMRLQRRAVGGRQIHDRGGAPLCSRLVAPSESGQRLAPFQVQATPARGELVGFRELGRRALGVALAQQRLAPPLEGVGPVGAQAAGLVDAGDG